MKVVFFGSPDFAVASLEALLASRHEVLGVVTQPDRPAGRGLKMEPPAVKKLASTRALPILQPEKVNCEETYAFLERLRPDLLVVVAYGGFLGKRLLEGRRHDVVVDVDPAGQDARGRRRSDHIEFRLRRKGSVGDGDGGHRLETVGGIDTREVFTGQDHV